MLQRPVLLAAMLVAGLTLPTIADSNLCEFNAYANDPDPAGANVRSGPSLKYSVIGVLKPDDDSEYAFTPEFTVTAFENGFFKIGDAVTGQYDDGLERTVFTGPGWISAKLVGFEIQAPNLYDAPREDAGIIVDLHDAWSLDLVRVETIHACEGGFLNVTITNASGASATGWVTNLCGNQATTCS